MFGNDGQPQDQSNVQAFGAPTGDITAPLPPSATLPPQDQASYAAALTDSPAPVDSPQDPVAAPAGGVDDLLAIKQEALQHLTPLVDHLEQSPEEKFRTTMMMIQASDDQSLVKTAYETAKQIEDSKARAQALLDIVNEINYFTQQQN